MSNDIHAIAGRIKNSIMAKDLYLSPAGGVLVNTLTLMLKDLYDFAETCPSPYKENLNKILREKEKVAEYIISLTTPKKLEPLPVDEDLYEELPIEHGEDDECF